MGRRDLMKKIILLSGLVFIVFTLSGCASLLHLPIALVKAPFTILSQILGIAAKLPKPPPWIFI